MKQTVMKIDSRARSHGLGEGVTLMNAEGEVMEFRERRGHVTLRRGRNDPKPQRVELKDAAIWQSKLIAEGWLVNRMYVEDL